MKKIVLKILPIADILLVPLVYISALLLKYIRRAGVHRMPFCKNAFLRIGVFPISAHYYEPQFMYSDIKQPFSVDRNLPGIKWNTLEQLQILKKYSYGNELANIPSYKIIDKQFHFNNGSFESGDAEYWYQIIRSNKPSKIIEVGSGYSTLMAMKAICENQKEDLEYSCQHICIEPYEMPWLEETGVTVIRRKIEDVELSFFSDLNENDILFIDSSHMIKPQGDVLFEYLELLPSLNKGVIVHLHDIFSPKNYLRHWLQDEVKFWNEQYLLEAFLSNNSDWKIIGALNYLHHNQYDKLKKVSPYLSTDREPGSFYIQKIA